MRLEYGAAMPRVWRSGFVNRWHTNDDHRLRNAQDTTAAHAQRVALLVAYLAGPDLNADLLLEALLHDAPEKRTGDVPFDAKQDTPAIQSLLTNMDRRWFLSIGVDWDGTLHPIVALADRLDAILFVRSVAPDVLETDNWPRYIELVIRKAESLGLLEKAEQVLG